MFFLDKMPDIEALALFGKRFPEANMTPDTVATYLLLCKTASMLLREQDRHLAKFGLSQARFQVLILLERTPPGEMSPAEITREMGISMKNTLRLIDYMEKDGLLSRRPHETDGRASIVGVTQKGRELLVSILPGNYRFMNRAFANLDARSRAVLRDLLDKVNLDFPS